jgi:hypothetical protein
MRLGILSPLSLLVACGAGSHPPPDAGGDADADADVDGDADGDGDGDGEVPQEGDPCTEELATFDCYEGPDGTASLGACHSGLRTCIGSRWRECWNQATPETEWCDGIDNDCDGEIDQGETCPRCPGTWNECFGPEPFCTPFTVTSGLELTDEGWLSVAPDSSDGLWSTPVHIEGCSNWGLWAVIDAEPADGATIAIRMRVADAERFLADAPWSDVGTIPPDGPQFDLQEVSEEPPWIEIQTELLRGGRAGPTVRRVDVCWSCEF